MKYGLLIFAFLINVIAYFYLAIPDCLRNREICFGNTDLAPVRYRVLQPMLERLFAGSSQESVVLADFGLQALLMVIIIAGLYSWLRRWTNEPYALIGVLMFDLVCIVSYHFYMRSLSTTIELAVVLGVLWLLPRSWRLPSSPA